ncbi:Infection Response protein [Chytriomyces hyalinus]|nr:Infection Response protein [Chytriomyces hyalinus]
MSSKKELFELIQQFRTQLNCAALPEAFRVPPILGGNGFFSNTSGKLIFNNRVYCFTGASSTHLDNWSTCTLTIGQSTFQSSEQVIFAACKAGLFRDEAALMHATSTPEMSASQAKYLGRNVQNFVDTVWKTNARWLSDVAILIKCLQNAGAMEELVRTRGLMIAEGSKQDLVWGIGMEACYQASLDQNKWRGKNWLGQSLVRVREFLLEEEAGLLITSEQNLDLFYSWFEGKQIQ